MISLFFRKEKYFSNQMFEICLEEIWIRISRSYESAQERFISSILL